MTTTVAGGTPARTRARRGLAGLVSTAVAASGLVALGVAGAPVATAAAAQVTNATLTWDLNNEVNAGAFAPGTWNLMSAGKIGNPGAGGQTLKTADSGTTWNNGAAAGWSSTAGNVTIEDKAPDGSYGPATFQGTRTNSAGQATSGASQTILAETRLVVRNGAGSLDAATDNATITWDGDATVLFYSGMTYFTLSDPKLTLVNGAGTVTATLGGYATSMEDSTQWEAVPEATVALASISGVDVTPTGLTATPAYREVPYAAPASSSPQVTSGASWGSFPQAFVDFQQALGQGPYWYSTGGSADPRKPANPLSVSFTERTATVQVSKTTLLPNGAQQVSVTGSGFDPTLATGTRPPLLGKPSGTYVAFGKFAESWKPSTGAPSSTRVNSSVQWAVLAEDMATIGGPAAGAIELTPAGTFTATLTVDKADIDTKATAATLINYGVYTYAGGGASAPAYETYTPITFAKATPTVTVSAPSVGAGAPASATVTVTSAGGATGDVTLTQGDTVLGPTALDGTGKATFDLGSARPVGSYPLTASYSGNANTEARTAAGTLVVAAPSVELSRTSFLPTGEQQITVTGTGFTPSAAVGSRPPLAGRPAGVYVAFGKFAQSWKPSAGAPASARVNSAVQWAVLAEDMATIGGPAAGAIELSPTGSFTATLKIDKTALDAKATAADLVNYGIFTYPGGGASAPPYETYTPVTFAKAVPAVTVDAPAATFGTAGTVTVTVTSAGEATGDVTLTVDGTPVGSPTALEEGTATFALPADLAAGQHVLAASYSGNANTEARTAEGSVVVGKSASTLTLSVPSRTYGQVSTAVVTVAGDGATGAVTLSRAGRVVGTAELASGRASFSLGELDAGQHRLTASYAGNGNVAAATATATTTVAKATSRAAVKVTRKPTRTRAGKVRATITTTPAGSATGKVKLVLRTAKGKLVRTVQARLNARGIATATLPKLAKGRYRLVLTYATTANVKRSTRTVTVKVS